ncbi:putative ppg3 [Neospora caninum Liverpool]|uniref:Putative ppg3 n=1 Tax=Neospora caninum (strain Liverpool) TaxID=572307 RepID=F0V8K0_NEOCL|nr:putative ppg3 [Neospora caninum Liverpool]CBZ50041.1 putative ppg3 [Neospora caninum Liverpool]|eukprot:XP_003880076.1 putative ppg3 [Neospora caninum Liverpool]
MSRPTYAFVTLSPSAASTDVLSSLPGAEPSSPLTGASAESVSSSRLFSGVSAQRRSGGTAGAASPSASTARVDRRPVPSARSTDAVTPPASASPAWNDRVAQDGEEPGEAHGGLASPRGPSVDLKDRRAKTGSAQDVASEGRDGMKEKGRRSEDAKQLDVPFALPKSKPTADPSAKLVNSHLQSSTPQASHAVPQIALAASQSSSRSSPLPFPSVAAHPPQGQTHQSCRVSNVLSPSPLFLPTQWPALEPRRLSVPEFDGSELPAVAQEDAAMMLKDFASLLHRLEFLGRESRERPRQVQRRDAGSMVGSFLERLEQEGQQSLRESTALRRRLQEHAIICASMHARLEYLFEEKREVKERKEGNTASREQGQKRDVPEDSLREASSSVREARPPSRDCSSSRGEKAAPASPRASPPWGKTPEREPQRTHDGDKDNERERKGHVLAVVTARAGRPEDRPAVAESNRSRLHLSKLRQDFLRLQQQYERLVLLLDIQVLPFPSRDGARKGGESEEVIAACPTEAEKTRDASSTEDRSSHDLLQLLDFNHFAGGCGSDRGPSRFIRPRSEPSSGSLCASFPSQGAVRFHGSPGGALSCSGEPSPHQVGAVRARATLPALSRPLPTSSSLLSELNEDVLLPPLRCGPTRGGPSATAPDASGLGQLASSATAASPSVSFVPSSASLWRPTSLQEVDEHLEESQRQEQLEQLRHLEQCVHVLHEMHLNIAGDVAAAEEPILAAVDETESARDQVAHASRELVDASLRRSRWWGLQGGGAAAAAGVFVGAAAGGPVGAVAGAVVGAFLGAGSGGALRRQHRKKIKKLGERLERQRRRPHRQARGTCLGALVDEDGAAEEATREATGRGELHGGREERHGGREERRGDPFAVGVERELERRPDRRAKLPERRERARGTVPWLPSVAAFGVAVPRLDRRWNVGRAADLVQELGHPRDGLKPVGLLLGDADTDV